MRKRTIRNLVDEFFWLAVALMPLLLYALQFLAYELTSASEQLPTFLVYMGEYGVSDTSITYTVLNDIFGATGILPLFKDNSVVLLFLSYFTTVEIVHLAVDFILFIPRLSHKWLGQLTFVE